MIRTSDFVRWVGGTAQGPVPEFFEGVSFDSRRTVAGGLYAALPGERVDGHSFVVAAIRAGAALALVRADWSIPGVEGLPLVRVPGVRAALTAAARCYRHTLKATVVGVTGSSGKTTTKEFLAAFLRTVGKTHATAGNYNNGLGLPVTILNAPADSEFLVLEMGTSHPGEIAGLVDVARPDVGVVTSIGTAHIEHFGTQEAIAREKGVLLASLPANGFAVVALNCQCKDTLKAMCTAPWLETDTANCGLRCPLPGEHNFSDMALAAMCALQLGADRSALDRALEGFSLPGARWKEVERDGVRIVNDAYNANPASMAAALKTFAALPVAGRRIAVLGDMFELGAESEAAHRGIGRLVAGLGFDALVCVGDAASRFIAEEAAKCMPAGSVRTVADADAAARALAECARPGDSALIKASNGVGLWKLA